MIWIAYLISSASHFSPSMGRPSLRAERADQRADQAVARKEGGAVFGVDRARKQRMFERANTLTSPARD